MYEDTEKVRLNTKRFILGEGLLLKNEVYENTTITRSQKAKQGHLARLIFFHTRKIIRPFFAIYSQENN